MDFVGETTVGHAKCQLLVWKRVWKIEKPLPSAFEVVVVCVRCSSPNYITNIMSDDPQPCTDLTTLAGCGYKGTPNSTLVGIIVGSVFGVLLLLLVIFCSRR